MSCFGLSSARGTPSRSTSTIVADGAYGCHVLHGCSFDTGVPGGGAILSSPFIVGGYQWRIKYLPDGAAVGMPAFISVYLLLDENVPNAVTAKFKFALVVHHKIFFIKSEKKVMSKQSDANYFTRHGEFGYASFAHREAMAKLLRPLKSFAIRCDVTVINGLRVQPSSAPSVAVPPSDLNKNFRDLLRTGRGADVEFEVGGERFLAHRYVLASQAPVISQELLRAEPTGVVRVDGIDPHVFRALLHFAYTDSLMEPDRDDVNEMYQNLLVAADRFYLQRLKLICEDELCRRIDVGTVETNLALAEQHRCIVLKKACLEFLNVPSNLRAVMAARG